MRGVRCDIAGKLKINIDVKQETHQLVGQAKRRATKIRPQAVGGGIFGRFFKLR